MEIVGFLVFLPLSALISRSVCEFCLSAASVPGRCPVLSNCATTAQQERRKGQTHPGEVAWPIMSWRIRGRLLVTQPGERWGHFLCFLFLELFFLLTSIYPLEVPWHEMEPSPPGETFPMACGYGGRNQSSIALGQGFSRHQTSPPQAA